MFIQQVLVFTYKIQSKTISSEILRRKGYVECFFIKHNTRFISNVPIINQLQPTKTNKPSIPLLRKLKFSNIKSSIEELKEKTAKIAEMYYNKNSRKEWSEEEMKLLFMALEIHGKRWKFIHNHYFNYRTLHSVKCKWDREKVKCENSYKKIISKWTPEEDKILLKGIEKYGKGQWRKISRMLPNKESMQVFRRYYNINCTKRGNFTDEEDNLLCDLLKKFGGNYWQKIADEMDRPAPTLIRHYKMVMLKSVKFPKWTIQENKLISDSILKYGKDWKKIQELLPHRLSLSIKEHVRFCSFADPCYNSGFWKVSENMRLIKAVRLYGKNWQKVSKLVETRSPFQCRIHFRDSFTRKSLESCVLNLELKGIENMIKQDQAFLEELVAKRLLDELSSSEQESKNISSGTFSSDRKFLDNFT